MKRKIGTKEPSKEEAERLEFLSYVEKKAGAQADQYHKEWIKWKNKKQAFFPVAKN